MGTVATKGFSIGETVTLKSMPVPSWICAAREKKKTTSGRE